MPRKRRSQRRIARPQTPATQLQALTISGASSPGDASAASRSYIRGPKTVLAATFNGLVPRPSSLPFQTRSPSTYASLWPSTSTVRYHGVDFLLDANATPTNWADGDSYWRALSLLLYGTSAYYPYIKVQHLLFYKRATSTSTKNITVSSTFPYQRLLSAISASIPGTTTLLDVLTSPAAPPPPEIVQLTALLYGISFVIFRPNATLSEIQSAHALAVGNHGNPIITRSYAHAHGGSPNEPLTIYRGSLNSSTFYLRTVDSKRNNSTSTHWQPMAPQGTKRCRLGDTLWCDFLERDVNDPHRFWHFLRDKRDADYEQYSAVPRPLMWSWLPVVTRAHLEQCVGLRVRKRI